MKKTLTFLHLFIGFFVFGTVAFAQPRLDKIKLTPVFTGLNNPVVIANCGDDRMFIVEQRGVVRIGYPDGTIREEPFFDMMDKVNSGGEMGLLGMAFPKDFKSTGNFYINYTAGSPLYTKISRMKVAPDSNKAVIGLEKVLLDIHQPYSNHNGGCIQFGPDNYLYIGMGDGGSGGDPENRSQNKKSMLGKMLRIDVSSGNNYEVPDSNPFYYDTAYIPEIWALGLRNPWKFSFDPHQAHMWIADVGQSKWEEIDFEPASDKGGHNYGWRCYEGFEPYNTTGCGEELDYTFPAAVLPHDGEGNCSVTGGEVFVSNPNSPLYGGYIYADYCSGRFWITKQDELMGFTTTLLYDSPFGGFTAFGYDQDYNIYVARNNGTIYRIDTIENCVSDLLITATKDTILCKADSVLLSTQVFDFGTYQWYRDGQLIPNSNTPEIYVKDGGSYYVQFVSDSCVAWSLKPRQIMKTFTLNVSINNLLTNYCENGAPLVLEGTPSGGFFDGVGVEDNVFYPDRAGLGTFLITYYLEDEEGCVGYAAQNIKVNKKPTTDILTAVDSICLEGAPLVLEADPVEGSFSGFGVSGTTFYPQVSGTGVHTIYYQYEPWPGCIAIDSIKIVVYRCIMSNKQIAKPLFSLSPNPAQTYLNIQFSEDVHSNSLIEILDISGKVLWKSKLVRPSSSESLSVPVDVLTEGVYIVRVSNAEQLYLQKFVKN